MHLVEMRTHPRSLADMKGIKFRTYNETTYKLAVLARMSPIHIETVALRAALSSGVVEAFVSSSSMGLGHQVWDYVNYFYDVRAWLPRSYVFANAEAFKSLNTSEQNCLRSAAEQAETNGLEQARQLADKHLLQLFANGIKVRPPSESLIGDLTLIGAILIADWIKMTGDEGLEIIRSFLENPTSHTP